MDWLTDALAESTLNHLLLSLGALLVALIGRVLVRRLIDSTVDDHESQYRARKVVNYSATFLFLVTLAFIWVDAFETLPTYLGLVSAGIAIALSDVLKNMAGWVLILTRKPFEVGDRIEVMGLIGDIVDVRLFRFSMLEVGGWVEAEQSTGRLVHVPNGIVFNHPVANYTEGFAYIWDEIPIVVTFESDWKHAEELVREVLAAEAPDLEGAAESRIRETARNYSIRIGKLTPNVYVSVRDHGVLLTARYLVETRTRRGRADRVWRAVLEAFAGAPNVDLAYPTTRTYLPDALRLEKG